MRSCGGDGSHGLFSLGCMAEGQGWNWGVGAGGGGACTRLHMDFYYGRDCEWGNDVGDCNDYTDVPADDMASATWQHVAITYDGTTLVGYRNGAEIARHDRARNDGGVSTTAPATCATGDTTSGHDLTDNLVAYFNFEEGPNHDSVTDATGNGHDGTWRGGRQGTDIWVGSPLAGGEYAHDFQGSFDDVIEIAHKDGFPTGNSDR